MCLAWLQATKPCSQAKPNGWLHAGLGLGLESLKPKPRARALASHRVDVKQLFDFENQLPLSLPMFRVVLKLLKEHQDFDGKPGLKPKPGQAKPPQLAQALAWENIVFSGTRPGGASPGPGKLLKRMVRKFCQIRPQKATHRSRLAIKKPLFGQDTTTRLCMVPYSVLDSFKDIGSEIEEELFNFCRRVRRDRDFYLGIRVEISARQLHASNCMPAGFQRSGGLREAGIHEESLSPSRAMLWALREVDEECSAVDENGSGKKQKVATRRMPVARLTGGPRKATFLDKEIAIFRPQKATFSDHPLQELAGASFEKADVAGAEEDE
ncbi:hypothetical protein C8R45DRAFT_935932 [Mycena sanguinolenta]|nr:hypothetical protein C8R45DRAFT_935932 [Mycena sanguinolenta]